MPPHSPPYIYYAGKAIPEILKSYMQRCWQMSPETAQFYITVATCPQCAVGLRGHWRRQIDFIMNRVIDEAQNTRDPGEMVEIAIRMSPEHMPREWSSEIREDFINLAPNCKVIQEMMQMGIVQEKVLASNGGTNQTRRPTMRGGIEVSRHACELFEDCSQYYEYTRSFRASVEGRLEA